MAISIRRAQPDEHATVATVLDAGLLVTPELAPRIDRGEVLVAVDRNVVGAVLFATTDGIETPDHSTVHVEAIAVRPGRRDQGIGRQLIEQLASDAERVTAEYPNDVRPFYEACGFEIESVESDLEGDIDDRLRGVRTAESR
jgi:ribosomal protein S18 acetylase RimI-like enzyme